MEPDTSTVYIEEPKVKTRVGPCWKVIGLDDDITTQEYVIKLLMDVFHKSHDEALQLMLEVHESGSSIFYRGSREACELKVEQTQDMNSKYGFHFQVKMECDDLE